jgi:dihydrofolate reductase
MVIRTHVGVSLDGFVADADGVAAWESLPGYEHRSHGIAEVLEHSEAVVMGRSTFDRGLAGGPRTGRGPTKKCTC